MQMALSVQQDAFALQINQKGSRLMASLIVSRTAISVYREVQL